MLFKSSSGSPPYDCGVNCDSCPLSFTLTVTGYTAFFIFDCTYKNGTFNMVRLPGSCNYASDELVDGSPVWHVSPACDPGAPYCPSKWYALGQDTMACSSDVDFNCLSDSSACLATGTYINGAITLVVS